MGKMGKRYTIKIEITDEVDPLIRRLIGVEEEATASEIMTALKARCHDVSDLVALLGAAGWHNVVVSGECGPLPGNWTRDIAWG